jgi:long-chain fatty acid transport protein
VTSRRHARSLAGALVSGGLAVATLGAARDAGAAGLYVADRGVRPLGRGGAFVAGADDLGAIWYNPAGIVDAPSSILLDGSYIHYTDQYTRQALTTSAAGTEYVQGFARVEGTTPFLPIPTIAGSLRFGDRKQYAAAIGVYAPDAALLDYPSAIESGPAPQRYSLISLNGSLLAVLGAWFSYKPVESIRLGVGVQMLTGFFKATVDFSACPPDNLLCAGEDPNYDAFSVVKAGPIFAPSANAGATWVPSHLIRVGLSAQAPFVIDSPATVDVRLPSAVEFDTATQVGNRAHLHLELPPIVRAGVELRPLDDDSLRIELAYVREFWSVEKSLDITPENIELYGITGFPSPFGVSTISVPRGMQDSNSVHLGGEYAFELAGLKVQARAGVSYESSSLPVAYVGPLTIDSNKVAASLGGSIVVSEHLRLDGVLSHTFQGDVNVTPQQAAIPLINPVKGNPTQTNTVNGGQYSVDLWVLGGGLEYRY